jgi:hypothetical protein
MKKETQLLELVAACAALALESAISMGWYSSDIGPVLPFWIRVALPCLVLFPIRPRMAAYWLDRLPWAVAIGLFLHRDTLPGATWVRSDPVTH